MTKNFIAMGSTIYNVDNQNEWIIYYSEFSTKENDWLYLLILADNKSPVILGDKTKVTGKYITERIKSNKLILNKTT